MSLTNKLYKLNHYYDELMDIRDNIFEETENKISFPVRHSIVEETMMAIPIDTRGHINLEMDDYEF